MVWSSMIVMLDAAMDSPSCPARKDAERQIESPEAASKRWPISERATSGANTMGTRWVGTRRAPRRRKARRAASCPIDSGDSRSPMRLTLDDQESRCIEPFASMAKGAAEIPQ